MMMKYHNCFVIFISQAGVFFLNMNLVKLAFSMENANNVYFTWNEFIHKLFILFIQDW